jgi:hypothetical protein
MKKILLLMTAALLLIASNSQAAFTPLNDGDYQMVITSGCFAFGDCTTSSFGQFVDNGETVTNSQGTFGTGIAGDGVMGIIDFTLASGNITVNSFSQDSYLSTAGGTFALDVTNISGMGGSIDSTGNMEFDPTGRIGIAQFFADAIGAQPWNIDDSATVDGNGDPITNLYTPFTTGSSSNFDPTAGGVNLTLTGAVLEDAGPGTWTGTLVSAGNVGTAWIFFDGTPYTEVFNVTITELGPPVPGVSVSISVQDGEVQECSEHGGSPVTFTAEVSLSNGGELSTLEWVFDGELISIGTELSVTTFASLGSHLMEVTATLVTGHTDSDSQAVAIHDTQAPDLTLGFIDMRSHEPIVEIADNQTHFVEIQMLAEDVCDPAPVVNGNVVPVFPVENADVIKVQGNKGQIDMPATALNLSGTATDVSGNTKNGNATLHIISRQ